MHKIAEKAVAVIIGLGGGALIAVGMYLAMFGSFRP